MAQVPLTHKFALNQEAEPADRYLVRSVRKYCLWKAPGTWCALLLLGVVTASAADVDIKLPSVTADGVTYSNVVIFTKSATHISISHAGGMASLKAKSLDTMTQRKLGYLAAEEPKSELPSIAVGGEVDPRLREIQERVQRNVEDFLQQIDKKSLYQLLTLIGILYLFFCYCCMQICKKTNNRPGLLVWVPGLQMIPLLRAAGMSPWLYFIPIVNFFASIVWCFRICRVRQKGAFLGFLLLLPVTSPLAFVYLALSGHPRSPDETDTGRIKLGFQST
jgi:hypothetical protein